METSASNSFSRHSRRFLIPGAAACLLAAGLVLPAGPLRAQTEDRKNALSETEILERLQAPVSPAGSIPLGATVDPEKYYVGPSDILGVNVWMSPPLSFQLEVTPEGTLIIPTVGEISVSGRTLGNVKTEVIARIRQQYLTAGVTVTLLRPRSILVTVQGTVLREGQYTMNSTDRADRVIQIANTPSTPEETVNLKIVERRMSRRHIVVRNRDGRESKADLVKYLATGADDDNPYLREGDVVVVPERRMSGEVIGVYGEVNMPGRFEFAEGDRLLDALRMGQGLTTLGRADSIEVFRLSMDGRSMEGRVVSVEPDLSSAADNFALFPGDRIVVRKVTDLRADYRVFVEGEVLYPGTYPITRDRTRLSEVIASAGGFTQFASLKLAELNRRSIDPLEVDMDRLMSFRGGIPPGDSLDYLLETDLRLRKEIVNVDFEKLFSGGDSLQDVILQTEDIIRIPPITKTVYVFGQIVSPGHIPFVAGEGADYYVREAGGFTERARTDDLQIIKSKTKQWLDAAETAVEEGDYIWVPKEPERPFSYYMMVASQAASVLSVIVGMTAVIISLSN